MQKSNEMITMNGTFLFETDRAILFLHEMSTEEDSAVWLPKSQILWDNNDDHVRGDEIEVDIPRWLVEAKDLPV